MKERKREIKLIFREKQYENVDIEKNCTMGVFSHFVHTYDPVRYTRNYSVVCCRCMCASTMKIANMRIYEYQQLTRTIHIYINTEMRALANGIVCVRAHLFFLPDFPFIYSNKIAETKIYNRQCHKALVCTSLHSLWHCIQAKSDSQIPNAERSFVYVFIHH